MQYKGLSGVMQAFVAAIGLMGTVAVADSPPPLAQVQFSGIDRVVAFADVHGANSELLTLLRETGIVDATDRWAAGKTHVVSLGDLLDRGDDSRKVMDLLMRLQTEARAAGGQLHVVLGNHEAMNILGDLRYVNAGEYAAYTDMESASERAEQRKAWETRNGAGSGAAFDQKFPPGYFGHRAAFAPNGKYGMWLMSLPVALVVNDTLFMHAGPGPVVRGMNLQELNTRYRTALADYLGLAARLDKDGLMQAGDDFRARSKLAQERLAAMASAATVTGGTVDGALTDAVQRFAKAADDPLLSADGPNWYRGAALCGEVAEADILQPLLDQFGVKRLVIGHTPTRDLRAVTRFDGRVVKLDTGMNKAAYKGRATALFLQPSGMTVQYAGEPGTVALKPEGLFVAPNELEDAAVLAAMRDGTVTVSGPRGPNELDVKVTHAGKTMPAVFQVRNEAAARKEIAAYLLDRQLGLGVVPATAMREVQGQQGVLQARPLKYVTQTEVAQKQIRGGGWCDMEPQFQSLYALDVLIGNEGRTPDGVLFDSDDWFVYASGNDKSFGNSKAFPPYLKAKPPVPGAELRRRAATLTEANLAATLGEYVDAKGRKAILERRDALVALPGAASSSR
ncbi:MAG: metallophosphoesterase [Gammaproteobacteria bacterium]|nr:metallophosphoesterase [Gammaproteobacteria bacterium]